MPYDVQSFDPARLQRADGFVELAFAPTRSRTGLVHLYQHDPCRALFPQAEPGNPPTAVLLTTAGGLTGGDRVRFDLAVRDGAAATVTSQAAEKIYRSLGPDCRMQIGIAVADGLLEWLPQETILFDGARLRRDTRIELTGGARLLACEMLVFGRIARGERLRSGFLRDGWSLYRDGRLIWSDALRLEGDIAARLDRPAGFAGAEAFATALYAGPDAAAHLEMAQACAARGDSRAGATLVNGVLLARFLGAAPAVRRDLMGFLTECRRTAAGLPPRLPRVWYN